MKKQVYRVAVVLAATSGLVLAGGWALERYLAHVLGERASRNPAAASELARLDTAAIEPLAEASASDQRTAAIAARREIGRLIRRWALQEAEDSSFKAGGRRLRLARELAGRSDRYSPAGLRWLAATADQLLLSNSPGQEAEQLIKACDVLFSAARRHSEVVDQVAASDSPPPPKTVKPLDEPIAGAPPRTRNPLAAPIPPEPRPLVDNRQKTPPSELVFAGPIARGSITPEPPPEPLPVAPVDVMPMADEQPAPRKLAANDDLTWLPPHVVGPTARGPQGLAELHRKPLSPVQGLATSLAILTSLSDRQLLLLGLSCDDRLVRAVIIERGFGEATRVQLETAFSQDEQQRLQLVDELLVSSAGATARLLLLMATDESPQVRSAAIGALGSSRNRSLIDAAWRMAVRDPDPRVARLATELQRRR